MLHHDASSQYITAKGGQTDDAFLGNNMVLSSTFPAMATDAVTLDFGYYAAWDATQGNGDKSFFALAEIQTLGVNAGYINLRKIAGQVLVNRQ
ncbi:MAG TPA: hypothetical protein VIO64_13220 [Pseudobacteroides sp.]|uniref:hypothetical protein n=1 Tax=Pseudobacteroides sp. TaxID=1968840 RepID=UPI002F93886C